MKLLGVFIRHEWLTQIRSGRFRGLAAIYILVASAPAVGSALLARRVSFILGAASYASYVDLTQPFLTGLFVGLIAVDAISREREESSLPVVSLAEMSAAGYVLRRWLAVMAIVIPVTLVPRVVSAALAAYVTKSIPPAAPFLLGWAIRVLPVIVIASALFLALGTITGRTVLAIIFVCLLPTVVLGIMNDLLAYIGRRIDMPDVLPSGIYWILRGWSRPGSTTDAAFNFTPLVEHTALQYGPPLVVAMTLLGLSLLYLRRTRRDLRPWHERADHPLGSTLKMFNRLRHEYLPDAGFERADYAACGACLLLAFLAGGALLQRDTHFMNVAGERFAAETATRPDPLPLWIVPVSVAVDGEIARNGNVRTRSTITLRNDGFTPQSELSFAINGVVAIDGVTADRGKATLDRKWERVGVTLDPPLRPGDTRTLTFRVSGRPAAIGFGFARGKTYQEMYRFFREAESTIDLVDFSKTAVEPRADETRIELHAADFTPVPRYTAWAPFRGDRYAVLEKTFIDDLVVPKVRMRIALRLPHGFVGADSCGSLSLNGWFATDCNYSMAEYRLLGAPLAAMPIGPQTTFAYIPAHAEMARIHGPVIADALSVAAKSWPGLDLSGRTIFLEKPTPSGGRYNGDFWQQHAIRSIEASGRVVALPELMLVRMTPVDRGVIASAIVANRLRQQRPLVAEQERFFERFFTVLAYVRIAGKSTVPVHGSRGPGPDNQPILDGRNYYYDDRRNHRLEMVLAHLEHRLGSERLIAGVNDFLTAGSEPGTAKEMLDAMGRRGGVNLDRVYSDYFVGAAVPKLTLENVTFTRQGARWQVSGELRNLESGESFCPVVLRTAGGSLRKTVRVDTKSATPFSFTTEHAPRTVQLDPEKICYRHAAVGAIDAVDFKDQSL